MHGSSIAPAGAYDRSVRIDLNADVGESFGAWSIGEDESLIPWVSSVNVAAGLHAGDPTTIARTIELAIRHGAAIGAHPGYPDLAGFGRRPMALAPDEIEASVLYQVGAVAAFARAAGVELRHVKAHGALYNRAARDEPAAAAIARAVARFDRSLVLVGLAGSVQVAAGRAAGLSVAEEAFADRAYEPDGSLRSRDLPGAVIEDPDAAAAQALAIVRGSVIASDGSPLAVRADTICVHGDLPGAAARARAVREALDARRHGGPPTRRRRRNVLMGGARILPFGDAAILVELEPRASIEAARRARALAAAITAAPSGPSGLGTPVPAAASVLVPFDPAATDAEEVEALLQRVLEAGVPEPAPSAARPSTGSRCATAATTARTWTPSPRSSASCRATSSTSTPASRSRCCSWASRRASPTSARSRRASACRATRPRACACRPDPWRSRTR